MSKTEKADHMRKIQRAASSPAARKKAVATLKRRRKEKQEAAALLAQQAQGETHMSLDAIPDPVRKKYTKKKRVEYAPHGRFITEKEWMFLQMAKLVFGGK